MKSVKRGLAVFLAALLVMPALPVRAEKEDSQAVIFADSIVTDVKADGDNTADIIQSDSEAGSNIIESSTEGTEAGGNVTENPTEGTEAGSDVTGSPTEGTETGSDVTEIPTEGTEAGSDVAENPTEGTEAGSDATENPVEGPEADKENEGAELISGSVPEYGTEGVIFSTGGEYQLVINPSLSEEEAYAGFTDTFGEDGSYTIQIPEEDPFFPYEVQFAGLEDSEPQNVWFMTPDSTVEFGGHVFRVAANFTGNAVTQLSLNIGGDTVVIYPQEKEFGGTEPISLLPLERKYLRDINLTGYTPLELTMVSVESVLAGKVELKGTDRVVWKTGYSEDYQINQAGDRINLAYSSSLEMIVGEPDQLAAGNIRYIIEINKTEDSDWLKPVFYTQDDSGKRTAVEVKRNSFEAMREETYIPDSRYVYGHESVSLTGINGYIEDGFLALEINREAFSKSAFTSVRAFEGWHESAESAMAATEVTSQIFAGDMSKVNAGYSIEGYTNHCITLVSFDAQGTITGCLPVELYYRNESHGVYIESLRKADGKGWSDYSAKDYWMQNGCEYYTYKLYKGNSASDQYIQGFRYYNDGTLDNSVVTAAYVGHYESIAQAQAAGAVDIKNTLFKSDRYDDYGGYKADYSGGVDFTVFIGEDNTAGQQVFKYNIRTEESDNERTLSGSTYVSFYGLYGPDKTSVQSVRLQDSYAENNYIVYIVNDDVDRGKLALDFSEYSGMKLYAAGSNTPEIPKKSFHDFSAGAVQFTASAENGENAKNYWVQVITRSAANGQLFINSLIDTNAGTKTENGVTYTTREVMLDGLHEYKHDIRLANMSSAAIANLSVVLDSSAVELDDYWTLKGNHELSGFSMAENGGSYEELPNLAMLRLKAKEGVEAGTEITGTLTFKSGDAVLMVMTLTGTVGDPAIITKEVPEAVKYVPYGTMIQNSNKYSWNTATYQLWGGSLPEGMIIRPNGELYGVPVEEGEFTFTVKMQNSYGSFKDSMREFTLIVKENTDPNVESQTDKNYELTERVTYDYNAGLGNQLMVSQGVYGEFVDLWLDGQKLTDGVDYTSESGSTRITILAQTLLSDKAEGTHTLGIEFRTADTNTLKRAAQNYVLGGKGSNGGDDNGSNNGSNDDNDSNRDDSNGSDEASRSSGDVTAAVTETTYTVVSGDTLWKIAVKFYGDGNQWRKIYEDNRDVLSDPNKIYVGQVLKIRTGATIGKKAEKVERAAAGGTYTVQSGDSLWKIAAKVYGNGRKWRKIYEANADKISDASKIYAGQVLVIPE